MESTERYNRPLSQIFYKKHGHHESSDSCSPGWMDGNRSQLITVDCQCESVLLCMWDLYFDKSNSKTKKTVAFFS